MATPDNKHKSSPAANIATGAAGGTAIVSAIAASVVPIVNAIGFTSSSIAAGSTAAGMVSASAVASGGVVSGSTVAVLQSIGAVGLASGPAAGIVIGADDQHESVSAHEPREKSINPCWVIATEEGRGNVRVYRYQSEADAQAAFDRTWRSQILYNPKGEEVKSGGVNWLTLRTIRQVMKDHYFAPVGIMR